MVVGVQRSVSCVTRVWLYGEMKYRDQGGVRGKRLVALYETEVAIAFLPVG